MRKVSLVSTGPVTAGAGLGSQETNGNARVPAKAAAQIARRSAAGSRPSSRAARAAAPNSRTLWNRCVNRVMDQEFIALPSVPSR